MNKNVKPKLRRQKGNRTLPPFSNDFSENQINETWVNPNLVDDKLKAELAKQCRDFSTNISDGSFDIIKSTYNEQPLLVFVIPTVITKENTELVLGVTITKQGDFKFNFIFNKQQYI